MGEDVARPALPGLRPWGADKERVTGGRGTTLLGIGLTLSSLTLMPALGVAKQRLGARLGSAATAGEGGQNLLCAYLAAAVLAGLVANSLLGWWWVDALAGLTVAAMAVREGRQAWRGMSCCAVPGVAGEQACGCAPGCTDACCAGIADVQT
jgi:hypothetical protein